MFFFQSKQGSVEIPGLEYSPKKIEQLASEKIMLGRLSFPLGGKVRGKSVSWSCQMWSLLLMRLIFRTLAWSYLGYIDVMYIGEYIPCLIGPILNPLRPSERSGRIGWDKSCSFVDGMKNVWRWTSKEKSIETWTRSIVSMNSIPCSLACWLCVLASICFCCERWFMPNECDLYVYTFVYIDTVISMSSIIFIYHTIVTFSHMIITIVNAIIIKCTSSIPETIGVYPPPEAKASPIHGARGSAGAGADPRPGEWTFLHAAAGDVSKHARISGQFATRRPNKVGWLRGGGRMWMLKGDGW